MIANKKIDEFRKLISLALKDPLPGSASQLKLSPPYREQVAPGNDKKDAAVLILIYPRGNSISTVFIQRNRYDGPHSGQISFPGGKFDKSDPSIEYTAIRETNEEIGTNLTTDDLIGKLTPLYIPISKFYVWPFIAISSQEPIFEKDDHEVHCIIEITLKTLLSESAINSMLFEHKGKKITVPCFKFYNNEIWGATAMMLNEFIDILKKDKNISSLL